MPYMGIAWGGNRDEDLFLLDYFGNYLFGNKEVDLMMLKYPPIVLDFHIDYPSCPDDRLCRNCTSHDVIWLTRSLDAPGRIL